MAGIDLPNHLFQAVSELSFAPRLDKLRPIASGKTLANKREDLDELIRAYLWALSYMNQRTFSCVWCEKGRTLTWTDIEYVLDHQIDWRQPFSVGVDYVDYHLYARTDSVDGAKIRINGSDGIYVEADVPPGGDAGGDGQWHLVKILGVKCSFGAPQTDYFTPNLQAKVLGSGTVFVSSMACYERPMLGFINQQERQFNGPINEGDPFLVGETLTLTPAIPVPNYEVLPFDKVGGVAQHNPLSADTMIEIINGVLTILTRRTRISYLQIVPSGNGVHPDYFWFGPGENYPSIRDRTSGHLARIKARQPSNISGLGTKYSIHVKIAPVSGHHVQANPGIRFLVPRGGVDPVLEIELDRDIHPDDVFQWHTGTLDVPFEQPLGTGDREIWIQAKGGIKVENILIYTEKI